MRADDDSRHLITLATANREPLSPAAQTLAPRHLSPTNHMKTKTSRNAAVEMGSVPAVGRSGPRPRGPLRAHEHLNHSERPGALVFGARHAEPQPGRLRSHCVSTAWLLPLLLLLTLPAAVQAQFSYTTDNGTVTITGYTGPGGAFTIPSTIGRLPISSIGERAFAGSGLTSVTIPNGVKSVGEGAVHELRQPDQRHDR